MCPCACSFTPLAFFGLRSLYDILWGAVLAGELLLWAFGTFAVPYAVYRLLSLPLRREERARLFLDVLQGAVARGRSAEETLTSLAAIEPIGVLTKFGWLGALLLRWPYHFFCDVFGIQRDEQVFGNGIRNVGERLMDGVPLHLAIEPRDNLLPGQIVATLRVGSQVGDLKRVLPACRRMLADAASRTRAAVNYLALMMLGVSFVALPVILFIGDRVAPMFGAMMEDIGVPMSSPFRALWVYGGLEGVFLVMLGMAAALLALTALYVGGPRLVRALRLGRLAARLQYHLPWRRKRLQRDFSAMLGILLDAGVPEPDAVVKAAESTANHVLIRRAWAAQEAMERGVPLTEALRRLDDTGEFQWRLANAAHVGAGFAEALAGWEQSLDARAFQQEQAAAHVITSVIAVFNGVVVAMVALGVFQCLMTLTRQCLLW